MRRYLPFLFFLFFTSTALGQSFSSSNLPLVFVQTGGKTIPDDPKIDADMGIIWNEAGNTNAPTDAYNNYNGKIGIELRGSSSQSFPKKSYGLELKNDLGEDIDASLLGMPAEEDWILNGPYSDKSLIRNVLIFTLDATLGHYSPRCRFVEMFLNDQYQGVYVLTEKIKRDSVRLDLSKLNPEELSGEDLTGGYIIKVDKTTGSGGSGWYSAYLSAANRRTFFQYEYPKFDEIQPAQKNYIEDYIDLFEKALHDQNFDGTNGFRQLADEDSFIDYMIMNELSKNVDGYRLSTFLHKDKNGKLKLGPIWDFNLAFGNANYYNGESTSGFQFEANLGNDEWQNPFWWEILFEDNTFRRKLKNRWSDLRANQLSDQRITTVVDSLANLLNQAQTRNFQKWPILSTWVWPNAYVGNSYSAEISWLKSWINNRLNWLDTNIEGLYVGAPHLAQTQEIQVFPNPFRNELYLEWNPNLVGDLDWMIYTMHGTKLAGNTVESGSGQVTILDASIQMLPAGVYFIRIMQNGQVLLNQKLVKQ